MLVTVVNKPWNVPSSSISKVILVKDNWNDYGFYTTFSLVVFDEQGEKHEMGLVQIAFKGQEESQHTYSIIDKEFMNLDEKYFSIGGGVDYYSKFNQLTENLKSTILISLRDIAYDTDIIRDIEDESVFETSLLRSVSLTTIKNQYNRILRGNAPLTEFKFKFLRENMDSFSDIALDFEVYPESKPNTNIHVLIGRNGIGKTTILNGMIDAVIGIQSSTYRFVTEDFYLGEVDISKGYFSRMVSVSFSAFDPFKPYKEQNDPTKGTRYSYIGLKSDNKKEGLKDIDELYFEFIKALKICLHLKKNRWLSAIQTLESDSNFSEMNLKELVNYTKKELDEKALEKIRSMSSGHAIVLIILTQLLATVEEKTLVLLDEPESHLHPPLLSAFIRTLSDILIYHNGVAIIATHSPVVLQEVPKSCVWKIIRTGNESICSRPNIETFGENVGTLTRDVFGLEVEKSGFYNLLSESVSNGGTYQSIINEYENQLGLEGRLVLKSLLRSKDSE